MLNMVRIHDISVYVFNDIPMEEYRKNTRDQTSKYTIPNNGAYYVNHGWDKNQRLKKS